jgi:CarD family transcriptional regulator
LPDGIYEKVHIVPYNNTNTEVTDAPTDASKKTKAIKLTVNRDNCDPIIKSGDNEKLASLIKLLRDMRRENRKSHKGLNIQEERILADAERVFFSEIATAYSIPMDECVSTYTEVLD